MTNNLSIAFHTFSSRVLKSFSVYETMLRRYLKRYNYLIRILDTIQLCPKYAYLIRIQLYAKTTQKETTALNERDSLTSKRQIAQDSLTWH